MRAIEITMWLPGILIPLIYLNIKVTGLFLYTCMTCVSQVMARNVIFLFHSGYDYDRCGCSFDVLLDLEWPLCFDDELSTLLG